MDTPNLTPDEADFLCDLLVAMGSSYLHLESTYNRNGDEVFFGVTYDEEGEHYIKIKDFIREIYDDMMCLIVLERKGWIADWNALVDNLGMSELEFREDDDEDDDYDEDEE